MVEDQGQGGLLVCQSETMDAVVQVFMLRWLYMYVEGRCDDMMNVPAEKSGIPEGNERE